MNREPTEPRMTWSKRDQILGVFRCVRLASGAIMFPQLSVMDERIDQHNAMYSVLMSTTIEKLEALKPGSSRRVYFIPQAPPRVFFRKQRGDSCAGLQKDSTPVAFPAESNDSLDSLNDPFM